MHLETARREVPYSRALRRLRLRRHRAWCVLLSTRDLCDAMRSAAGCTPRAGEGAHRAGAIAVARAPPSDTRVERARSAVSALDAADTIASRSSGRAETGH